MAKESVEPGFQSPVTLTDWARHWGSRYLEWPVSLLARLGFTPNAVTFIGLALNLGVGWLVANGLFVWGGGLMLLASGCDALDGSLARLTGRQTRFGAFLDSTLDRYSEALVLVGLAWFYAGQGGQWEVLAAAAALTGSMMVSYTRARAEGLGLECKVGLLTRLERVIILVVALLLGWVRPALWVLALLANVTAIQRIVHVWRATRDENTKTK